MLKTIQNNYVYEYEIKKSKFIGFAFLVSNESEVEKFLEYYRKKECVHSILLYALALLKIKPSVFYKELNFYSYILD